MLSAPLRLYYYGLLGAFLISYVVSNIITKKEKGATDYESAKKEWRVC